MQFCLVYSVSGSTWPLAIPPPLAIVCDVDLQRISKRKEEKLVVVRACIAVYAGITLMFIGKDVVAEFASNGHNGEMRSRLKCMKTERQSAEFVNIMLAT